eukprot:2465061-Amphidinium_carterae.2
MPVCSRCHPRADLVIKPKTGIGLIVNPVPVSDAPNPERFPEELCQQNVHWLLSIEHWIEIDATVLSTFVANIAVGLSTVV